MVTITSVQGNYNPTPGGTQQNNSQQLSHQQQPRVFVTRESEAKNLIIRAWRERWTDVQWGIQVRKVRLCANSIVKQNTIYVYF